VPGIGTGAPLPDPYNGFEVIGTRTPMLR